MMHATLTSKGQITVPKPIRDRLHLRPGDKLEFLVEEDGSVRVVPVTRSLRQLRGVLKQPGRIVSLEEMDEAISQQASKA